MPVLDRDVNLELVGLQARLVYSAPRAATPLVDGLLLAALGVIALIGYLPCVRALHLCDREIVAAPLQARDGPCGRGAASRTSTDDAAIVIATAATSAVSIWLLMMPAVRASAPST